MKIENVRWEMFSPERQRRDRWSARIAAGVILGVAASVWAIVIAVVFSLI